MLRALLVLLLAAPAFAQLRAVPALTVPVSVPSALSAATLSAPSLPDKPAFSVVVPSGFLAPAPGPARTAANLRDDADRLYASLAKIHSRVKAGEKDDALKDVKLALIGDFDGAVKNLAVTATGDDLRARVKALRKDRAAAEKALLKAPSSSRAQAARDYADVSGTLAAYQLKAASELLLSANSPVNSKAWKRNAALWALVGAHNSASAAAAEAAYLEALAKGEQAFGDGRPYLYWNRWRSVKTELETAARDARNGREDKAAKALLDLAAVLKATGDKKDAADAAALETLAAAPDSDKILARAAKVAHPSIKVRTPVAYSDMNAGLRSQVHALESARADYLDAAASVADLRRAAILLSSPKPTKADLALAAKVAAGVEAWAKRGRVDAKRTAALNLEAAREAQARGDLKLAARHLGWAADALQIRLGELERIALAVRRRLLASLS